MKAEDYIMNEVQKITTEERLKSRLKLFYPELKYNRKLIEEKNGYENLKFKKVENYGTYIYYSSQGKMDFHEFILDMIIKELKKNKVRYRRGNRKDGADLYIKKYKIELEIRSNPSKQPENRPNLINRVRHDPDNTIIIVLNRKDKEAYLQSKTRKIIHKYKRIFILYEFMEFIKNETGDKTNF